QRWAQVGGLAGEHRNHLVQVPVGGGPRDAVIAGQRLRGGAVAEPAHPQDRLPEAGQRPAALRGAAAAPLGPQQFRGELHQFPGDVEQGGPRGEVPAGGPFPRGLPPNPAGAFRRTGLSSGYAACATGGAWMWSWHWAQTTSVLRRIFAMSAAHAGWPGPGLPGSASLATWWTATAAPWAQSSPGRCPG